MNWKWIAGAVLTCIAAALILPRISAPVLALVAGDTPTRCVLAGATDAATEGCITRTSLRLFEHNDSHAMEKIEQLSNVESLGGRCHVLMHDVGRRLVATHLLRRRDLTLLIGQSSDTNCAAGVEHGVIAELMRSRNAAALDAVVRLCRSSTSRRARKSCIHGVGHGASALPHATASTAVAYCASLGRTDDRDCAAAVFHQLQMETLGLLKRQLHGPLLTRTLCRNVSSRFSRECWVRLIDEQVMQSKGSMNKVFSAWMHTCSHEANMAGKGACATGVSYALQERYPQRMEARIELCATLDGPLAAGCIDGVYVHVLELNGASAAINSCAAFDTGRQADCVRRLAAQIRVFSDLDPGPVCEGLDPARRAACNAGAHSSEAIGVV
mgnify:CR=1 FL=1